MKRIMTAVTLAILSSPLPAFACDGSIKCAIRNAPRQALHMLPGFLSTHAGLLIGIVVSIVVVGIVFRREAELVTKD
jgi:mannitol-specific phosphotransferase system IIBC component